MYRKSSLLVAGLITGASLMLMAGSAAAEANCPQGATCKCTPTTFTKCKADAQGNQYDCQTYKGEKCEVVSGPGSGKPKAAVVADPVGGTTTQPTQGTTVSPKQVAPSAVK